MYLKVISGLGDFHRQGTRIKDQGKLQKTVELDGMTFKLSRISCLMPGNDKIFETFENQKVFGNGNSGHN